MKLKLKLKMLTSRFLYTTPFNEALAMKSNVPSNNEPLSVAVSVLFKRVFFKSGKSKAAVKDFVASLFEKKDGNNQQGSTGEGDGDST